MEIESALMITILNIWTLVPSQKDYRQGNILVLALLLLKGVLVIYNSERIRQVQVQL